VSVRHHLGCLALLLGACAAKTPAPATSASDNATAPNASGPIPAPTAAPSVPPLPPAPFHACGALDCKAFPDAVAAFDFVLAEQPRVLAIGEAHAQSDAAGGARAASSTKRFMDALLPRLAPRASDLVIELWLANGSCGKVEKQVEKQQGAVTAPQAATNQNEFLELGHRAKALGIMPHALVPSCDQYQKIAGAGAADIEEMLTMIRDVTRHDVEELLTKRAPQRLIVAYGGAMHNDLAPRAGREAFSFGPGLSETTRGRYVELDLVIPEQIKDTDAWRAQPWYAAYSRDAGGSEARLYSWAPHAYALLFPKTTPSEVAP
jgi:hypothetical protein